MSPEATTRTAAGGYGPQEWWPWAPMTRDLATAIAHSSTPDDELDRGWEWARASRDQCGLDGAGSAGNSWQRAAEVLAGIAAYRACACEKSS